MTRVNWLFLALMLSAAFAAGLWAGLAQSDCYWFDQLERAVCGQGWSIRVPFA